jgi:carbamate kinase
MRRAHAGDAIEYRGSSQAGVEQLAAALAQHRFPAGSMGPKVEAACHFARATGRTAAIGALADIAAIVRGEKGTQEDSRLSGITSHR